MVVGALVGAVQIAPGDVLGAIGGGGDATTLAIVRDLRLPRVAGAAIVGGALAVAGTLRQALLRTPVADRYVTVTSAGASLGAVVAIALGATTMPAVLPLAAFAGALVAVAATWRLAALGGRTTVLTVLLGGVILTSFAGAVLTFLIVASDRLVPRLPAGLGWVFGRRSLLDPVQLLVAAPDLLYAPLAALAIAPPLDAFAFGAEAAATPRVRVCRPG